MVEARSVSPPVTGEVSSPPGRLFRLARIHCRNCSVVAIGEVRTAENEIIETGSTTAKEKKN